jgi:hypothetical protein
MKAIFTVVVDFSKYEVEDEDDDDKKDAEDTEEA